MLLRNALHKAVHRTRRDQSNPETASRRPRELSGEPPPDQLLEDASFVTAPLELSNGNEETVPAARGA
jgi:hypothetical protein